MSALYERSQLTQVMISSAPATAETMEKAEYLRLDCTIKEVQFTAGQKQDIDVTTLCSTCMRLRCCFRPVRALSSWRKCVSTPGHPVPTAWWQQRFHCV
ncbi:major tail subunit encoded within prophage CP-933V [Escherichia coli]|nr:major tail subunit encoded within prophage CP-933V [Escherichia coli]